MRPDKCSEFELTRIPFDPSDVTKPIQWLAKPHGEFFLPKGAPSSCERCDVEFNPLPDRPVSTPLFTNY